MNNLEKQFDRWINILRNKAKYEHNDRKNNIQVVQPDIDSICNEMEVFRNGFLTESNNKIVINDSSNPSGSGQTIDLIACSQE